jgi:hypothetical protein
MPGITERQLAKALRKAIEATQLDLAENYAMAVRSYDETCALLESVDASAMAVGDIDRVVDLVHSRIMGMYSRCKSAAYTTRCQTLLESRHVSLVPRYAPTSWQPIAPWAPIKVFFCLMYI